MKFRSDSVPLFVFSDRLLRIGIYIPYMAVIAFALLGLWSHFYALSFTDVSVPSLITLQNQRAFLVTKGYVRGLNVDFIMFEVFAWISFIIGLLRFLTGIFSAKVLSSFRVKFENMGKHGKSPEGILVCLFLIGPLSIFCSVNFEFDSHLEMARFFMEHSPRSFICISTFMFCGGVFFLAESILGVTWLLNFSE